MLGNPDLLPEGHTIAEAALLFAKIEDDAIQAQLDRLAAIREEKEAAAAAEAAKVVTPQKDEVTFDDFMKWTSVRLPYWRPRGCPRQTSC